MKFCSNCGTSVHLIIPQGDNRHRHVCTDPECNTIHYENPRIITGVLPLYEDKVLLCKRAIEPRYGLWTLPAGFMENGETTEQGAVREAWEEALATPIIEQLYTLFNLPHINQVYFFYKAQLANGEFGIGEESLAAELFSEEDIPWEQLAFPVVTRTLQCYFEDRRQQRFPFRSEVIDKRKT